jgi:phosphoglycolate phosphatase-like HAD superfamily hydrolase
MIRLVLFDIDGTLIRTGGAGVRAFERTFALEFGVPDATREVSFAGRTDSSLVRELFLKHSIPCTEDNFARFYDAYVFLLHFCLEQSKGAPCAGVAEFVHDLRSFSEPPLIGLLTGNIRLGAEIKLRHYGLWELFQFGAFADDDEDRQCLAKIARQRGEALLGRGVQGSEVLVIGDTPLDVDCARSIGANILAVGTGGYTCAQLRACTPTWVAESLSEIRARDIFRPLRPKPEAASV